MLGNRGQYWRPLADIHREMDRALDEFWAPFRAEKAETIWSPACDIEEGDGHFLIEAEMPGLTKDQIKVEVHDNEVRLSGERTDTNEAKAEGRRYTERKFGKFYRAFTLPADVDANRVEAQFENGILKLYVPKAEATKPRHIRISDASEKSFFGGGLSAPKNEKEGPHSLKGETKSHTAA